MADLLPLFVNLSGRRVLLVGGGPVAAAKLAQLLAAGADVRVVAPGVVPEIARAGVHVAERPFVPEDLDGAWLVVAAATPEVNREVARAAERLRIFVNAVDDPANATAFLSGVVRRGGVTLAISTNGVAPGLTALLREALDAVLPRDLGAWVREAARLRPAWRRQNVPMAERRPRLLAALNRLYGVPTASCDAPLDGAHAAAPPAVLPRGHVSLVGAGPGDAALLTRRAAARLRAADLVLYDALVDEQALRLARRAQRFFVGKRAGRHALTQTEIQAVMIRAARRGRRVVRLKGGDPFVFGRGGEEAMALAAAGVPFDVVPGISSATAAPALAGIPVTCRGVAGALVVVSGHDADLFDRLAGAVPSRSVSLVVLMGYRRRQAIAGRLIARGWSAATPAALVADASLPQQAVWRGALGDLAEGGGALDADGPTTMVVGRVAALDVGRRIAAAAGRAPQELTHVPGR
jgi:uroporphyrin-III C-methyltransferase/precorrin-2 dehydrogenase/sirohydrochlorin ferrochelatase